MDQPSISATTSQLKRCDDMLQELHTDLVKTRTRNLTAHTATRTRIGDLDTDYAALDDRKTEIMDSVLLVHGRATELVRRMQLLCKD
jgi:hypothetical protein